MRSSSVAIALASMRPIQIGSAVFSSESLSTTIGMLVNGSSVSPETFMSIIMPTSVSPWRWSTSPLLPLRGSNQCVCSRLRNLYSDLPPDQVLHRLARRQGEIDHVVAARAATQLTPPLLVLPLHQYTLASTQ